MKRVPEHDVEVALRGLEIEDEREKEAIRSFYARERKPISFSGREILIVLGWSAVGFIAVLILLWGVLSQ